MDSPSRTSPTSAVVLFATSLDLVFCLTDVISKKRLLATLRLVNTLFHSAATPRFFRSIQITSAADEYKHLLASRSLGFIRRLTVNKPGGTDGPFHENDGLLAALLKKLPLLDEFTCKIPAEAAPCRELHRACPNLKSLHLELWSQLHWNDGYHPLPLAELLLFEGLRELSLSNLDMSAHAQEWALHIARILSKSPRLKRLSITARMMGWEPTPTSPTWFGELCEAYARTGSGPLPLQALHCQPGLGEVVTQGGQSFRNMIDLQSLEEVRFDSKVSEEIFSAIMLEAPKLRRVYARDYTSGMHRLLSKSMDPMRMWELAIFFQYEDDYVEAASMIAPNPARADDFPTFPLQPRMMHISLDRRKAPEDWTSNEAWTDRNHPDEVLELLVSGPGRRVLEGLLVYLPTPDEPEVLSEAIQALEGVLPSLINLSQLRVIYNTRQSWSRPTENKQTRPEKTELASKLAKAGRHLRYISVDWYRWSIVRHEDPEMTQLEELSYEESLEVELFDLTRTVRPR
ncbi:hypothetical protein QBC39DRAFT_437526 [Podospora conica]|nr:hypothetical protein QBC39DRAFT_437526 [Schizothecium conicum]